MKDVVENSGNLVLLGTVAYGSEFGRSQMDIPAEEGFIQLILYCLCASKQLSHLVHFVLHMFVNVCTLA